MNAGLESFHLFRCVYKTFDSNVTPFGGIHLIHKQLFAHGAIDFIDNQHVARVKTVGYHYSDILLSRIYTVFCGGNATEDVNYVRGNTLKHFKGISIPSADTILRGDKELSVPSDCIETASGKANKINVNPKMNEFLVNTAIKFKQLNNDDKNLIYDFDHHFIPAEKYDAEYSYKNQKGYFPRVATISNIPVYIEGRNGNCNVKTEQLSTHKRALKLLAGKGINHYGFKIHSFQKNERMKFFIVTLISNSLFLSWVYPDDVLDIPEPFHRLYSQCSMLHNQQPRSDVPNIFYQALEIPVGGVLKYGLSFSLPKHLYSKMEDILYAYGYGLYLQHPLIYERSRYHKSVLEDLDIVASNLLLEHGNDILLLKLDDSLDYLLYVNFCDEYPYNKSKTFIETKVSAMKLQGFNI